MVSRQRINILFSSSSFGLRFVAVMGLAAAGQYFLAQTGEGSALGLGIGLYVLAIYFLLKWFSPENNPRFLSPETLSRGAEAVFFLIILALGLFLRDLWSQSFS